MGTNMQTPSDSQAVYTNSPEKAIIQLWPCSSIEVYHGTYQRGSTHDGSEQLQPFPDKLNKERTCTDKSFALGLKKNSYMLYMVTMYNSWLLLMAVDTPNTMIPIEQEKPSPPGHL